MSWDQMRKSREEGGSSRFVKLKDGDAIEGVFLGDPHCFYKKFKDPNEYSSWAEGRSFKFRVNFAVKEGGKWVVKILEQGATVRDQILDAIEEYSANSIFKIKRTGAGKDDTRYAVLYKGEVSKELKIELGFLKLNKLQRAESPEGESPPHDDDYLPHFDYEPTFP